MFIALPGSDLSGEVGGQELNRPRRKKLASGSAESGPMVTPAAEPVAATASQARPNLPPRYAEHAGSLKAESLTRPPLHATARRSTPDECTPRVLNANDLAVFAAVDGRIEEARWGLGGAGGIGRVTEDLVSPSEAIEFDNAGWSVGEIQAAISPRRRCV